MVQDGDKRKDDSVEERGNEEEESDIEFEGEETRVMGGAFSV